MGKIYYAALKVPDGALWAASSEKGIIGTFTSKKELIKHLQNKVRADWIEDPTKLEKLQGWLNEFYKGKPVKYEGTLDLIGTKFQKKVWRAIFAIPHGKLTSYGQIAKDIGLPKAARAVGNAVGTNPLSPVIPCHRVIRSNGGIGGFGGGLDKKRQLLCLEGVLPTSNEKAEDLIELGDFFYR